MLVLQAMLSFMDLRRKEIEQLHIGYKLENSSLLFVFPAGCYMNIND